MTKPLCEACGTGNAIDAEYCMECGVKLDKNGVPQFDDDGVVTNGGENTTLPDTTTIEEVEAPVDFYNLRRGLDRKQPQLTPVEDDEIKKDHLGVLKELFMSGDIELPIDNAHDDQTMAMYLAREAEIQRQVRESGGTRVVKVTKTMDLEEVKRQLDEMSKDGDYHPIMGYDPIAHHVEANEFRKRAVTTSIPDPPIQFSGGTDEMLKHHYPFLFPPEDGYGEPPIPDYKVSLPPKKRSWWKRIFTYFNIFRWSFNKRMLLIIGLLILNA